jgi:hypothetical protein
MGMDTRRSQDETDGWAYYAKPTFVIKLPVNFERVQLISMTEARHGFNFQ